MPTKMVTPTITEVSGVDRAANLVEGWAVMKSLDPEVATTLAVAEATATGVDLDALQKGNSPMTITDEEREALPENVRKYVEEQEAAVAKAAEQTPAEPVVKLSEEEAFEKAIESLEPAVREIVKSTQREAAEAKALAKQLADEKADAEFSAVVKSLSHVPEVNDEFTPVLRKLAESDPEAYAKLTKTLAATEAALKESELFKENGSGLAPAAGSADEAIQLLAKSYQEKDPELTNAKAMVKAAQSERGRELYAQHRRELNERASREAY